MSMTYRETVEFVPVDADKGLDRLTGKWVFADAEAPEGYTTIARCNNCHNYTQTDEYLGVCEASQTVPKFVAYSSMCATTCEYYEACKN